MKTCSKCGLPKDEKEYNKHAEGKGGLRPDCKECEHATKKRYRAANREKLREADRQYALAHPERIRENARRWAKNNPEKIQENGKKFRESHPEYEKERHRKYGKEHPEKRRANANKRYKINPEPMIANMLKWRQNNPEKYRECYLEVQRKIRATPKGKLNNTMGRSIWTAIKKNKNGMSWEVLVGYTVDQLKSHIEKQFQSGMSWDNYCHKVWHVDHKIPKSVFNYETAEDLDFKRCWALTNLRPMWATENMKKSNHLQEPFQPALAMAV